MEPSGKPMEVERKRASMALKIYGLLVVLAFLGVAISHLIASIGPTNVLAGAVLTVSSQDPMDTELVHRLQGFVGSIQIDDTNPNADVTLRDRDGNILADTLPDAVRLITTNVESKRNLQGGGFAALCLAFVAGFLLHHIHRVDRWVRFLPIIGVFAGFALVLPCLTCEKSDVVGGLAPVVGTMVMVLLTVLWTLNPRPTRLLAGLTLLICLPIPLAQAALLQSMPYFCGPCIVMGVAAIGIGFSLLSLQGAEQPEVIDPGPLIATLCAIVVISLGVTKSKQLMGLQQAGPPPMTERQRQLMGLPASELLVGNLTELKPATIYMLHQDGCRACEFADAKMKEAGLSYVKISVDDEASPIQPNMEREGAGVTPTIFIFDENQRVIFVRLGWPSDARAEEHTIQEMKRLTLDES